MNDVPNLHNRRSRRSQVLMAASIEMAGVTLPVKLRNLSTEGALIEGDDLPALGSKVVFRKKALRLSGYVAWNTGKKAGVAFDTKLDPEAVLHHVPEPRHQVKPDFRRPRLRAAGLTEAERKIGEDWIWGTPAPWLED